MGKGGRGREGRGRGRKERGRGRKERGRGRMRPPFPHPPIVYHHLLSTIENNNLLYSSLN